MYSNFRTFDKLDELNTHLEKLRHPHVVVYFRANWNPNCEETDKHALQLAADNYHLHVIKIDTDIAPKIAHVYAVTAEP